MDPGTFEMAVRKIEQTILKLNTTFREAISPRQKLMVYLRYYLLNLY